MKEKQESLRTTHENKSELIKHEEDLCEVCDSDLYHNEKYTKRIGMLDSGNKVCGWMCPKCKSEFDFDNKILYIYGQNSVKGKA
jgi:uncharacterized protein with PIN domain